MRIILWHTDTDELELGQWFKGEIFGGLSDLSPNGSLFIYVAEKWTRPEARARGYGNAWTAISKPPYLTALALWPAYEPQIENGKPTSLQLGGGLFIDDRTILLNHPPEFARAHPQHLPQGIKVVLAPEDADGFGRQVMRKRGWVLVQEAKGHRSRHTWVIDQPAILEKQNRKRPQRALVLIREYSLRFAIRDRATGETRQLEGVDWADWDQKGRLIFTRGCSLFAAVPDDVAEAKLIGDFGAQRFEPIETPEWATHW